MLRQLFNMQSAKSASQQSGIVFKPGGLLVSAGGKIAEVKNVDAFLTRVGETKFQREYLKGPIHIRFDSDAAIIRKLTNAAMPESRQSAAALFDMQASTPFKPSDFFALNVKPVKSASGAFYAVVKRSELGPLLGALEKANLKVNTVTFEDRGQVFLLTQSALKGLVEVKNSFLRQSQGVLLAACMFMLPLTFAHYNYQHNLAVSQLEQSIEPLTVEAKALRVELDKRAALVSEIQTLRKSIEDSKPAITIWEELSRVLPDSSFLTDVTMIQDKVSIAGYTQSASSIIVALEASSIFDEVSFSSPVVKVPGRTDDRFSIDLKIGTK